jgi:hypothetical protein
VRAAAISNTNATPEQISRALTDENIVVKESAIKNEYESCIFEKRLFNVYSRHVVNPFFDNLLNRYLQTRSQV